MSQGLKQQIAQQEEQKRQNTEARRVQVMEADYSAAENIDQLFDGLSTSEIKLLANQNVSFKAMVDKFNAPPEQTSTLAPSQDEIDAARAAEIAAEVPAPTPEEAAAIAQEAVAAATEAGAVPAVARGTVEILYDGVEKLGEGSYKLTVSPGDGTPDEVFFGPTQADLFKALRKSKASATKELRRRAKKVKITDELRALAVEVINYPPLIQPLVLSPDEIFILTEQQKDPVTVLDATRKLRQASLDPNEIARQNEAIERQRFSDGYNTAITWIQQTPQFFNCAENIEAMQKLMGDLNWAVTPKNLDLAYDTLVEQGVLLERPEEFTSDQPVAQPASVVPVAAVATAPVAVAPATPAAPAVAKTGALPDANRQMRPADAPRMTTLVPTRRSDSLPTPVKTPPLSAEEYNNMPASVLKKRYSREPEFKAAVDALIASGKVG